MIKLLIFDVDGVLVKSKDLHEIAFVESLKGCGVDITRKYHKQHLDGLPTKVKLSKLSVAPELAKFIFDKKQELTFKLAPDYIKKNERIRKLFKRLHNDGYKIAIASNAIRQFCELILEILEIHEYVDLMLSNEDVKNAKPDPEIYNKIIEHFEFNLGEVVVFEDSKFGLKSAFTSGAHVFYIQDPSYLTEQSIYSFLEVYKK